MKNQKEQALKWIKQFKGPFKMNEALTQGITRYMLYTLRDQGYLETISRGLYQLKDSPPLSQPDLVTVSLIVSKGIICLLSALDYHQLTTQIPRQIHLALPKDSRSPRLSYPPIRVYRFGKNAYLAGIEEKIIDGVTVRIYNPEKTLVDCFKFRNTLGMDIVLEALRMYQVPHRIKDYQTLLEYAKICRVESVIRPYLEAST
jgi:predicted transcriptional regulator of viral defense system